ncbi:MAG: hypothetical protein KA010_00755 [Saprospiraceae bacterium]|nr:hypothetical protein [Saprospiraceae bacterium]
MKRYYFFLILFQLFGLLTFAQPTYIAVTGDNNGSGSNNLFGNCLNPSQNAYINWETYVDGASCGSVSSSVAGQGSKCRAVLRNSTTTSDPSSVVASQPIYINGIFDGDNGNNDKYYVNVSSAITTPGIYSVEIQCTCNDGIYDNEARTTWNYSSPSPYWSTPSPDPIANSTGADMTQVGSNVFLGYFTVGDIDMYRSMIVFNNTYYDLLRFTPGNPPAPTSLQTSTGSVSAPLGVICGGGASAVPTLSLGSEVNTINRAYGGCSAGITECKTYYKVYKQSASEPAYTWFAIPLNAGSNCPNTYDVDNGIIPTFSSGGSCYSESTNNGGSGYNCTDAYRRQTTVGVSNILPTSFSLADAGTWVVKYYNECTGTDCSGSSWTETDGPYTATFEVTATQTTVPTDPCYAAPAPITLTTFNAKGINNNATLLNWTTSNEINNDHFVVQHSFDGLSFQDIAQIKGAGTTNVEQQYQYLHSKVEQGTHYYRLMQMDFDGNKSYSRVEMIEMLGSTPTIRLIPNPTSNQVAIQLVQHNDSFSGEVITISDLLGRELMKTYISAESKIANIDVSS